MSDVGSKALAGVGVKSPNPVVSTTGRVVFDTQQQRITLSSADDFEEKALGFDPKLAAARANPFALERIRYYAIRKRRHVDPQHSIRRRQGRERQSLEAIELTVLLSTNAAPYR